MSQPNEDSSTHGSYLKAQASIPDDRNPMLDDKDEVNRTRREDFYEWYPDNFISFHNPDASFYNTAAPAVKLDGTITKNQTVPRDTSNLRSDKSKFGLIILNQPIEMELATFRSIWIECIS
jgi:hypothetical protein